MAKTKYSKIAALQSSLCGLSNPRLCLLSGAPSSLQDPTTWAEVGQYATTSRPSLSGGLIPASGSVTTGAADTMQLVFPTSAVTLTSAGSSFTVYALAVVDGTAAFTSATVGRVVDIVDKAYTSGDVPLFEASSWTAKE